MPLHRWAIVLAAGDGTRLRALTTDAAGIATPKQYCSLRGGTTLLRDALRRAMRVVPRQRVVVVVAAEHERWWRRELADLPADSVVVQPKNRGTAPGLLLPLSHVLARDRRAVVAVLPSDHYVRDEVVMAQALMRAFDVAERDASTAALLGITPDAPESEYGWIVPRLRTGTSAVEAFVEKPERERAIALQARGGVWNSFLFAAAGPALLAMCERNLPGLAAQLTTAQRQGPGALAACYDRLESTDFSRCVLQTSAAQLRVLTVPECGWTDLGTPQRVAECLRRVVPSSRSRRDSVLDLGRALAAVPVAS